MKSICAILVFCVLFYSAVGKPNQPENKTKIKEAKEKCLADLKIDESKVKPFYKNAELDTDDKEVKCFFKCWMHGLKTFSDSGEFTEPEDMSERPQYYKDAFKECKTVTGSDDCDKAFAFHKCFCAKKHAALTKEKEHEHHH